MAAWQVLVSGLAQGCIYGLIALGFVLIYKATETVSFAQGDLMMVGGFVALLLLNHLGWPLWAVLPLSVLALAALGLGLERLVIRPVLGQPAFSVVMLTLGLGYLARGLITMLPVVGTETHRLNLPYGEPLQLPGGLVLAVEQLVVMGSTVLLCGLLFALFRFTRVGLAMQAASQNQLAAHLMGIPVRRLNGYVWALAAGVAALAAVLLAPITFVHANMGLIGLKAFPAAVVGGFGSLPGAILGGLIIGVVEALAGFYLPEGFKDVSAYVLVLVVLVLMPHGLLGERQVKRV
ncbi:branched-chain amino acid transport system permease protein [Inhella inkyongensis]|uniref:Branched-chain amino acid transport system permease protein n=1 Tax=Inhella inkyongensis TaxID=392593 RepID=A0A840S6Y3_9BURK|nr:branched-chain amino acid ABC transporter permease [Inhella inkyongensis]MBB5204219.1 branched-chain amino acid transport system permease protein [Inhella inkyongensis]